jgi:hypothetical protein
MPWGWKLQIIGSITATVKLHIRAESGTVHKVMFVPAAFRSVLVKQAGSPVCACEVIVVIRSRERRGIQRSCSGERPAGRQGHLWTDQSIQLDLFVPRYDR